MKNLECNLNLPSRCIPECLCGGQLLYTSDARHAQSTSDTSAWRSDPFRSKPQREKHIYFCKNHAVKHGRHTSSLPQINICSCNFIQTHKYFHTCFHACAVSYAPLPDLGAGLHLSFPGQTVFRPTAPCMIWPRLRCRRPRWRHPRPRPRRCWRPAGSLGAACERLRPVDPSQRRRRQSLPFLPFAAVPLAKFVPNMCPAEIGSFKKEVGNTSQKRKKPLSPTSLL